MYIDTENFSQHTRGRLEGIWNPMGMNLSAEVQTMAGPFCRYQGFVLIRCSKIHHEWAEMPDMEEEVHIHT
jgi:hypothetical protein